MSPRKRIYRPKVYKKMLPDTLVDDMMKKLKADITPKEYILQGYIPESEAEEFMHKLRTVCDYYGSYDERYGHYDVYYLDNASVAPRNLYIRNRQFVSAPAAGETRIKYIGEPEEEPSTSYGEEVLKRGFMEGYVNSSISAFYKKHDFTLLANYAEYGQKFRCGPIMITCSKLVEPNNDMDEEENMEILQRLYYPRQLAIIGLFNRDRFTPTNLRHTNNSKRVKEVVQFHDNLKLLENQHLIEMRVIGKHNQNSIKPVMLEFAQELSSYIEFKNIDYRLPPNPYTLQE